MQVDDVVVNCHNLLVVGILAVDGTLDGAIDGTSSKLLGARRALHFLVVVDVIGLIASLRIVLEALGVRAFGAEVAVIIVLVRELVVT